MKQSALRYVVETQHLNAIDHQENLRRTFPQLKGDCAERLRDLNEIRSLPTAETRLRPYITLPPPIRAKIFDFFLKYRWDKAIGEEFATKFGAKVRSICNIHTEADALNKATPEDLAEMLEIVRSHPHRLILTSVGRFSASHLQAVARRLKSAAAAEASLRSYAASLQLPDDFDRTFQEQVLGRSASPPRRPDTTPGHVHSYYRILAEIESRAAGAARAEISSSSRESSAFHEYDSSASRKRARSEDSL